MRPEDIKCKEIVLNVNSGLDKNPDPSKPIINNKWEKFLLNKLKGMNTGEGYTAAGYKSVGKVALAAGTRLLTFVVIKRRMEYLQRAETTTVTDIRDLSRLFTAEAVQLQARAMRDESLAMSVRLVAAEKLIERGHGKAPQTITLEPSAYESLPIAGQRALLAAIELVGLGAGDDGDGPAPVHH